MKTWLSICLSALWLTACTSGRIDGGDGVRAASDSLCPREVDTVSVELPSGRTTETVPSTADDEWITLYYEGDVSPDTLGRGRYRLSIRHRLYSGDGTFVWARVQGGDTVPVLTGRRYTQRGIPGDNDATVWQCVGDGAILNFLVGDSAATLLLLDRDFRKPDVGEGHVLVGVER